MILHLLSFFANGILYTNLGMALGAGANVRDRNIGVLCSIPCRGCDIADLSYLRPRMKGPPGGPGCQFCKDPNEALHCHVLGTRAAAFLFLNGSAVCLLHARGSGIPSALGFREGMGGGQRHWKQTPPSGNSEIQVPMFFLQNYTSQMFLIWLLAQLLGDSTFLCGAAEYSRC